MKDIEEETKGQVRYVSIY